MEWTFTARVIEWRGPAPFLFLPMPPGHTAALKELARGLEYWGQVPVDVTIRSSDFTTALFPKDGRYLVPLKLVVQRALHLSLGARVRCRVRITGRS